MKKFCKALLPLFFCAFFLNSSFCDEKPFSWDFSDCEISDVLFAVSMDAGISIIADDTVDGKCDFRFIGNDFEKAFDAFLQSNRLYAEKTDEFWTVSRFRLRLEEGLYYLDAQEIFPSLIMEKLSERLEPVITFDTLPASKISIHLKALTQSELMTSLAKCFGTYEVMPFSKGFHFARKSEPKSNFGNDGFGFVKIYGNPSDGYWVDVKDGKFADVLENLFMNAPDDKNQFCILSGNDAKLQRTVFYEEDFELTLEKLCSQAGFRFIFSDEIYYFLQDSDARNNLAFGKKSWERFLLKYSKPEALISLVCKQLGKVESFVLLNQNGFYAFVTENEKLAIEKLIESEDEKVSVHIVNLKYQKPEEMLKHLPPVIDKNALVIADDNSCLYFTGTEENYKSLCEQLSLFDKPSQAISYDLLILQYDESAQNSWSPSLSAERLSMGDRTSVSALLGSVMNLNLNVVGAFGMTFAASLQNSIEQNHTKVFADTTLHGVSGKKINFQNTNTYRYRDNNLDPETGKPVYSGVTREITSGIKLEILGWISGEGMITSSVTASITRQGTDTSSSTGNPPPTTEKVVTTEVRGKSGEAVVLSGLVQDSDTKEEKSGNLLSRLPLLGKLFKKTARIKEKSQMVIYLVPNIEDENSCGQKNTKNEIYTSEWAKNQIRLLLNSGK